MTFSMTAPTPASKNYPTIAFQEIHQVLRDKNMKSILKRNIQQKPEEKLASKFIITINT